MIIRVFRAQIHPGKEGEFERFVRETGVPTVQAQAGCSQVAWGRSRWSDQPEFVVVTHWDSVAALEAFAGPRWQEAVIKQEEEHMLAQVFCDHYAGPFKEGEARPRQAGWISRTWPVAVGSARDGVGGSVPHRAGLAGGQHRAAATPA